MNFTAKTEKQLVEERLIPEGVYPFEVITAEDKKSKKGNDMIELEVRLFTPDGRSRSLTDWIMEKMAFKLFHFCAYTGLATKYDSGTLQSHDCVGRTGFAKVGIQADKAGQYPDRNMIEDYVRPEMKKNDGATQATTPENSVMLTGKGAGDGDFVPDPVNRVHETTPMVRNEKLEEDVPF